jgi:superfamily II DNA or RNA helicase
MRLLNAYFIMQLRTYQENSVNEVATMLADGKRKVVFQLATGGGKTVVFSAISSRYIQKSGQSVLILVHRVELLQQTRRTLYNAFGITAQIIVAGMRHIPPAQVYVGMVESVHRRIPLLKNVGLVIIDEAHIAAFNKLHEHFPSQLIIGFTATPISANRKMPMKNYYEEIVCGVDIPDLITDGNLCQNITFAPKDVVDRSALTVKNGEFDEGKMAVEFSKPRYVKNTVEAYAKWVRGSKTIVFNCTIDHSRQVNNAFVLAGYNARHLDSTMTKIERMNILRWFATTPDAVLNNVGILTAGFDEPSIETVIFNKSTLSMPLWLQCTGRGARPTDSKSAFTIIDMGGNALAHGDWCDARDWKDLFHNAAKPSKGQGVSPVKNCPQCDAILAASVRSCKVCGFEFPATVPAIEQELSEFVVVTRGIDVRAVIERHRDKKEYYPFFKIGKDLAQQARNTVPVMSNEIAAFILQQYNEKAKEWCAVKNKKFNQWHQNTARNHLYAELARHYHLWVNPYAEAEMQPQ